MEIMRYIVIMCQTKMGRENDTNMWRKGHPLTDLLNVVMTL
jgi:hypothetical protein